MKSYLKILICSLSLSAALAVFSNSTAFILNVGAHPFTNNFELYGLLFTITTVLSYVINPVVVFLVFYLIGRGIDLSNTWKTIIICLAVGSWIGYEIILLPFTLQIEGIFTASSFSPLFIFLIIISTLFEGTLRVFSSIFFVALAALLIAYVRRAKQNVDSPAKQFAPNNASD